MSRRTNAVGVRQDLIELQRQSLKRWQTPAGDERLASLERGVDVGVSAGELLRATHDRRYAYRGVDWGARFMLRGDRLERIE